MKIFNDENLVTIKKQNVKETLLLILSFVILPLLSIGLTLLGTERPVSTSLSRISWPNGLYPVILIGGALIILNFIYGLYLTLKIGNYTNTVKKILLGISILGIVLITTGLSVPAYYNPEDSYLTMLRSIHAGFCIAGFAANLITLIIFTITLFKRNKTQFLINLVTDLFLIMSAAYMIIEANDINTYCTTSSVAQIYIFNAYNIVITINYFLMKYMPFNSAKQDLNPIQKIVEEDKEDIK